ARQPDRGVDLLLRAPGDAASGGVVDAVLADLELLPDGQLPQLHVVVLRAGEVLERGAEGLRLDDPEVDLEVLAVADRGLGLAPGQHRGDLGQSHEAVEYGG